jgi:hypothetical protein
MQLLGLMAKYGVSARLRARDPIAAVEDLRDAIDMEVRRNDFLVPGERNQRRSATVVLSFAHSDRAVAAGLLHDVGEHALAGQGTRRRVAIEQAVQANAAVLRDARAEVEALKAREVVAAIGPDALRAKVQRALDGITTLEENQARLTLSLEAERDGFGLAFERVDESVTTVRAPMTIAACAKLAVPAFFALSLIAATVLGAFDGRILAAADLTRRRIPLLGTLKAS